MGGGFVAMRCNREVERRSRVRRGAPARDGRGKGAHVRPCPLHAVHKSTGHGGTSESLSRPVGLVGGRIGAFGKVQIALWRRDGATKAMEARCEHGCAPGRDGYAGSMPQARRSGPVPSGEPKGLVISMPWGWIYDAVDAED